MGSHELAGRAAIAGLGFSDIGKVYGRVAGAFATQAVRAAVADAGLELSDVDDLIVSYGIAPDTAHIPLDLALKDLRLNVNPNAAGATASASIQYAPMAVASGMPETVVYVHADAPLRDPAAKSSAVYGAGTAAMTPKAPGSNRLMGANPYYALAARRHMQHDGTTSEQLGAIAVAQRSWPTGNPLAASATDRPRGPPELADDRRLAAPAGLLYGHQRRDRVRGDQRRASACRARCTGPRTPATTSRCWRTCTGTGSSSWTS